MSVSSDPIGTPVNQTLVRLVARLCPPLLKPAVPPCLCGADTNSRESDAVGGLGRRVGGRSWFDTLEPGRGAVDTHGLAGKAIKQMRLDNRDILTRHQHHSFQRHRHHSWQACSTKKMNIRKIEKSTQPSTYPEATHDIINVLAVPGSVRANTGTEAELFVGDEGSPLVVLQTSAEGVSKYQATNWAPNTLNASPRKRRIIDVLGLPLPKIHTSVTALEDRDEETE